MTEPTTERILEEIIKIRNDFMTDSSNCGLANYIIETTKELKKHPEYDFDFEEIRREINYTIEEIQAFNPDLQRQFYSFVLRYLTVDKTDNSIGYEHFPYKAPSEGTLFFINMMTDNIRKRFEPFVRIRRLARAIIANK